MSIPAQNDDARSDRFRRAIRLSPLFVAIVLAALWLSGEASPTSDLRLSAPVVARPGSSVGLRAWQVDEDQDGYTVIRAPDVAIELRDASGMTIASVQLQTSHVHGREGRLDIPASLDGEYKLTARAVIEDREVTVSRTLYVRPGIDSKQQAGRHVNAFQAYGLQPIRVRDPSRGPKTLDPRVEEGACAPELSCTLTVWVADWGGRIRVRSLAGVQADGGIARVRRGFARLQLRVVGPEALLTVEAVADDGGVLASRDVRLPVVPGAVVARTRHEAGITRLEWDAIGGPEPVLVDVFEGRRWVDALSLEPGDSAIELRSGVWRVQLRKDLFSDNTAGVTYVVRGTDPARAVARAADVVLAEGEGLDPLAMSIIDGSFDGDPDTAVRALFAVPSFDVVSVGRGMSARIGVDEALAEAQDARRWWAAALILTLGFLVSMALLRVEVTAKRRALRILEDLQSDDMPPSTRAPSGRGLWAFVLVVFVMMAVLALSKRWF